MVLILANLPKERRTKKICLAAVKNNPDAINFVPEVLQTEKLLYQVVCQNPQYITKIKDPSLRMCITVVNRDKKYFTLIKNHRGQALYKAYFRKLEDHAQWNRNRLNGYDYSIYNMELLRWRRHIVNYEDPTSYMRDLNRDALKYATFLHGSWLAIVKDQDEDLCLSTLKRWPWALMHVKNPTPEMIDIALNGDGRTIKYVKNPTLAQYDRAFRNNFNAINYFRFFSYRLFQIYIEKDLPSDKNRFELMKLYSHFWIMIIWYNLMRPKINHHLFNRYRSIKGRISGYITSLLAKIQDKLIQTPEGYNKYNERFTRWRSNFYYHIPYEQDEDPIMP